MEYLPIWTKAGSWTLGRDPLGMQATSVRMYRNLVPGLTNVTNRLRYYSFYCWVIQLYEKKKYTTDDLEWKKFIRRAEAVYALACYTVDPENSLGMAGGDWAKDESQKLSSDDFDLKPHTDKPGQSGQYLKAPRGNFGQFYIASMVEVGLLSPTARNIPIVSKSFGYQTAAAFEKSIGSVADMIEEAIIKGAVSRACLDEIGAVAHPAKLSNETEETKLLRNYLLANHPEDKGSAVRRASAWLALDLIKRGASGKNDHGFRKAFYNRILPDGSAYAAQGEIIDRWRSFQANEFCHIALEALLNGILEWQRTKHPDGQEPRNLIFDFLKNILPDEAGSFESFAETVSAEYTGREEELSEPILSALSNTAQAGDATALINAIHLVATLWARWGSPENEVRSTIRRYAGASGRSLAGVLDTLEVHAKKPITVALYELVRRHIIADHLAIAGHKLSSSGTFTYHFTLADGLLADGRLSEYGYTNPRLGNLTRFLSDAGLCKNNTITMDGEKFLNDAQSF